MILLSTLIRYSHRTHQYYDSIQSGAQGVSGGSRNGAIDAAVSVYGGDWSGYTVGCRPHVQTANVLKELWGKYLAVRLNYIG